MEAVSIPAKKLEKFNERYPDQDCAINFLAKKNHDIPLHEAPVFLKNYTDAKRIQYQKTKISDSMKNLDKPLQFSEVNKKYKATYRSISALNAIHSSDLMPEYDYFSLRDLRCRQSLGSLKGNRDIEFNRVVRSSVIDKKAKKSFHTYSETEYREVIIQRDEGGSFLTITVPKTLAKGLYSGVEVPRTPSLITPIQAPLSIAALPFIVAAASTAPTASKEPHNIALPPVWPKGTPSHFKLTRD